MKKEVNTATNNCSYWKKQRRNKHYMAQSITCTLFFNSPPRVVTLWCLKTKGDCWFSGVKAQKRKSVRKKA